MLHKLTQILKKCHTITVFDFGPSFPLAVSFDKRFPFGIRPLLKKPYYLIISSTLIVFALLLTLSHVEKSIDLSFNFLF